MKVSENSKKVRCRGFSKDESGQTTTEYVLLLVFVVMAVKSVGGKLNSGLSGLIDTAFRQREPEAAAAQVSEALRHESKRQLTCWDQFWSRISQNQ